MSRSFAHRFVVAALSFTTAALWMSVFCVSAGFVGLCAGVVSAR